MARKSNDWKIWTLVGLGFGIALAWSPISKSMEQGRETNRLLEDVKKSESKSEQLIQQVGVLESPAGREETARKKGFRRADEDPIR